MNLKINTRIPRTTQTTQFVELLIYPVHSIIVFALDDRAMNNYLLVRTPCTVRQVVTNDAIYASHRAVWVSVPVLIIMMCLACVNGLVMYAVFANCDPLTAGEIQRNDQVIFYFVADKLHHLKGLPGFISACVFAGSLSFISSGLNSLCLVILEDFVKKYFKKLDDFDSTKTCKLITVVLGCVVIGGAFMLHHCGETALQVFSGAFYITGGSFLGVFTLGMLIPRANSRGAYIGVASGLAMTIWLFTGALLFPPSGLPGPVSIADCPSDVTNKTQAALFNDTDTHLHVNPMARFYSMSYLWYCAFGWIVTMVIGTVTSLLFENSKEKKTTVNPKLVFPLKLWLLCWLPSQRKRWNSQTGLPQSDDKEDWVQLGERKRPGSEQLPRDSWRMSQV